MFDSIEDFRFHAGFRRAPHSPVDGETSGNLAQPAREAAGVTELRELSEGAEEDFLNDFVRFCGIAEPPEDGSLNLGLEHSHKLVEGGVIAALGLVYEVSDSGSRLHGGGLCFRANPAGTRERP